MAVEDLGGDTFPKLLLRHSERRGEQPAIREKSRGIWRTTSWRELAEEAGALAAALSSHGLKRGSHVAFVSGNRPHLYAGMCAVHWLGGVVLPLYPDATADELAPLIQSASVTHVFAEDQEQVDKLLEILPACPTVRTIIYDKDRSMRHYRQPQLVSYAELLRAGRETAAASRDFLVSEAARGSGEDTAILFFTVGTTGPAKGVVHTHASLIDRARTAAAMDGLSEKDVALAYLPPAWIGQNLFAYAQPLVAGYSICCPESSETIFTDLREIGPTYFLAPPSVLEAIVGNVSLRMQDAGGFKRGLYRWCMALAQRVGGRILSRERVFFGSRLAYGVGNFLLYGPLRDVLGLSRVRVAYTSGEAVAPHVLAFFRSIGVNLKQLYGSTETGFLVAMQRDGQVKADSVGPAAQGVEVSVTPKGEILVRSPGLFRGYHQDPAATEQAITADRWFHTGDAGYIGEDGHLHIIDRLKDIGALTDGTRFPPKLIETKLKFSQHIREAVAFGNRRDSVCALIDIDVLSTGNWLDRKGVSFTGHADLATHEEVAALIAKDIAKVNAELARDPALAKAQIRRFLILPKELGAGDGALTQMRKLRREAVVKRYGPLIEAMYDGRARVSFDTEVFHEDGSASAVPIEIRIHDASPAPERTRKAA